jgi:hypothetical protein
MAWLRTIGGAALLVIGILTAGCSGTTHTDGAGGASAVGQGGSGGSSVQGALSSICLTADESDPNFSGFSATELGIETESAACSSKVCLRNHFQGRVSCPYGQPAAGGGCFLPSSSVPVAVAVDPQLEARQANVASICTCRCAGDGPGPYCSCPASMECAPLFQNLGVGGAAAAISGSYCIPTGSDYDSTAPATACVSPSCGPARPY